jgi:hypothetical protein
MANYNQTGSVKDETELQKLKTGNKQSTWQASLDDAIGKILNREKFSYDLNGDALYQQYKDKYITQGQQAMMDTMGQAQAMTGGYGNSYAQMAGQQAYQGHLQQLNNAIPELYQLALGRYQAEGDDLVNRYAILSAQEGKDYDRAQNEKAFEYQQGRDQIADKQWQAEFDEAIRQYDINHGIIRPVAGGAAGGAGGGTTGGNNAVVGDTYNFNPYGLSVEQIKALQQSSGLVNNGIWDAKTEAAYKALLEQQEVGPENGGNGGNGGGGGNGDGFTGSTYSDAVAYMKQNGVAAHNASAILSQTEWQDLKKVGSNRYGASQFDSYADYLQYAVDVNIMAKK